MSLTAERLRELLHYDPGTGVFTWKAVTRPGRGGSTRCGKAAGCINSRGYRLIKVDRVIYLGHRLAWMYVHGNWPKSDLDHRDGVHGNNRLSNLREATSQQNNRNRRRSRPGMTGVEMHRCGKTYRARIRTSFGDKHLGMFKTAEEAHAAYLAAAALYHGEFARTA